MEEFSKWVTANRKNREKGDRGAALDGKIVIKTQNKTGAADPVICEFL